MHDNKARKLIFECSIDVKEKKRKHCTTGKHNINVSPTSTKKGVIYVLLGLQADFFFFFLLVPANDLAQ